MLVKYVQFHLCCGHSHLYSANYTQLFTRNSKAVTAVTAALTCEDLGEIVTFPLPGGFPSSELEEELRATPALLLLWRSELLSGFLSRPPATSLLADLEKSWG